VGEMACIWHVGIADLHVCRRSMAWVV